MAKLTKVYLTNMKKRKSFGGVPLTTLGKISEQNDITNIVKQKVHACKCNYPRLKCGSSVTVPWHDHEFLRPCAGPPYSLPGKKNIKERVSKIYSVRDLLQGLAITPSLSCAPAYPA